MPAGRPPKYDPEVHPSSLTKVLANGDTINTFCKIHDIHKDTFFDWVKVHPVFSDHYKRGRATKSAYYESLIKDNVSNKDMNPILVSMAARACGGVNTEERALEIDVSIEDGCLKAAENLMTGVKAGKVTAIECRRFRSHITRRGGKRLQVRRL